MKYFYTSLIVALLLFIGLGAAQAQTSNNAESTPQAAIMRYINAVNLHDYQRAYALLVPPQSYESFVAGYAETERIVPYFGRTSVAAGSVYVNTVLLGYQTDGTVESYYGFFQLANGGHFSPPVDGFVLTRGSFQLVKDGFALNNDTIAALVNSQWNPDVALPPQSSTISAMSSSAADTILDYYDLINTRDFASAFAQWLSPVQHGLLADYRPPFNQFVRGYGDTMHVMAYAGDAQVVPAHQQHSYLNAYLPVVLVGQHFDGAFVTFGGCYALGDLTTSAQGIVNGHFQLLSNTVPDTNMIFSTLNNLNCAALNIGI